MSFQQAIIAITAAGAHVSVGYQINIYKYCGIIKKIFNFMRLNL